MRRFSFIITILLLTLVSCAESGIKEYRNNYQVAPERLTATFEDVESTRIELQELYSVWSAGDEVSVFYHSYENMRWAFQGETGDRSGELKLVSGEVGEQTMNKSYMLYPYSENNSLGEDGMLYTSLPAEQSYKANSYGVGGNIVVAESEDYQFSLKNVCGWIRIQLTGDGEVVQSITLSSNKNEALAGDVAVNSSDAGYTLTSNGSSSITLDCGEGVTLSRSVTEFYIGILPQRLEGGITVDIVTDQDSVRKSTYEAVVVERNHILPMTAFRLSGEEALYSELRYTATALVEPYDASAFNAAIVSNEWDEATGEGVITFDGELTTIGNYAFEDCQSMTSITIPDSVTTLGWGAFTKCSTLREFSGKFATDDGLCLITDNILKAFAIGCGVTGYTIPNDVTSIAHNVFMECVSLTSVTIPDSVTTIGDYTFTWCKNLTTISIGSGVTSIGYAAFVDCSSLNSVYCTATTPPTLDGNGFHDNAEGRKIYVPAESVEAYKAAEYWSEYATDIVGYDFGAGEEVAISNKLFYTATALVEPYKASAFNVAIVSNEWNETTGEGVITFDGELTTIGDMAFYNCHRLTSVTIPDSVTTIGSYAFRYCSSLAEFKGKFAADGGRCLIIDGVLNAFAIGCGVTEYTIPDSVTTIGNWVFSYCNLTSVTIPDSVTTIGEAAFYCCKNLVSISFPEVVTYIGQSCFEYCGKLSDVIIPSTVTTIGYKAFRSCESLYEIIIPENVEFIGECAFEFCPLVKVYCKSIEPPYMEVNVFKNYDYGTGEYINIACPIYVPAESVEAYKAAESWSDYAADIVGYDFGAGEEVIVVKSELFYTATELVEPYDANAFNVAIVSNEWDEATGEGIITFDGELTTIGGFAFYWCSSLTSVTIPDGVMTIGDFAFENCNLTSVTIPDSVTTIEWHAFYNCDSLTSVTIPDSVTSIRSMAFARCKSLTEFKGKFAADGGRCLINDNTLIAYANASGTTYTIPDSVTKIGESAFSYCSSLTSVTIGNSVTTIGTSVFASCGSLTSVYCEATTPPTLGDSYVFDDNASGRKIYVPTESVEAYKAAENWSEYADYIVGYDFETGEVVE